MLKTWKDFWKEEEGMGTVEIILIIVLFMIKFLSLLYF